MAAEMTAKACAQILVVDDDPEVRLLLRRCLERESYTVSEAAGGEELFARLERGGIDLITLDLALGGEDGLDLARRIRSQRNVPIIMISGKGDTIDRVVGLELGADDYIAKPFHLREVLARVRAVLRRYAPAAPENGEVSPPTGEKAARYLFEGWSLDEARRELTRADGSPCELTTAEFNLLEIFVRRPGRVLSRDNIMDLLKGIDWSPLDRTIDNLIARLRKKLEADPNAPRLIKTVRGIGYVFTPDVARA
jgi:DNA-binding response OmpR family regulator